MTPPTPSPARPAPAPAHWGAEALWEALVPLLPGLSIEVVERIDSTNSELTERLRRASRVQTDRSDRRGGRQDDLSPQLLVAIDQTAGRGRLGRRWQSTPGSSLTFSLALPLRRTDWSGLSLAVGLAVADALDPAGRRLGLKWPNDLVMIDPAPEAAVEMEPAVAADVKPAVARDAKPAAATDMKPAAATDMKPAAAGVRMGRKLGGILIESVAVGAQRAAVIGIGINCGAQRVAEAEYGTASLAELQPGATPRDALARIAPALARALVDFDAHGFAPLQDAYARRDVLRGQLVRTTDASLPEGLAAGVDADGALRVAVGSRTQRVLSGEVSVRLAGLA